MAKPAGYFAFTSNVVTSGAFRAIARSLLQYSSGFDIASGARNNQVQGLIQS
jgi:hypothetical protein